MARLTKEELWEFFRDGDRPDEIAFKDLIDECYNADYESLLLIRTYGVAPINPLLNDYYINASENVLYKWDGISWIAQAGDKKVLYKTNDTSFIYIFDGLTYVTINPIWGKITGNIENQTDLTQYIEEHTPKGALESDILVSTTVGYINQGETLASGTTFENIFKTMLSKELDVEAVKPTVTIQNEGAAAGNKEIGVSFSVNLSVSYTDGYFKAINSWGQNQPAGCSQGSTTYYRNTTALAGNTDTYTFTDESSVKYKAVTNYGASTNIPKTNYGNDSAVRIATGQTSATTSDFVGCYKYFYVVNTSTKLTSSSTWENCVSVCTNTGLISDTIDVLGSTPIAIGDATHTKYVYVLIPIVKETPTFDNELNITATMTVIKNNYTYNGVTYKLCTLNPDGNAGDKYKNCKIIK